MLRMIMDIVIKSENTEREEERKLSFIEMQCIQKQRWISIITFSLVGCITKSGLSYPALTNMEFNDWTLINEALFVASSRKSDCSMAKDTSGSCPPDILPECKSL